MEHQHALTAEDQAFIDELKRMISSGPEMAFLPPAREAFDGLVASLTPAAEGVDFHAGKVAGVEGVWCLPKTASKDIAILYLHGGAFVLGSAESSKFLASQIAERTGYATFVPNYALAPESPFPAAPADCLKVLRGLQSSGWPQVALVGESAGGGLALLTLVAATHSSQNDDMPPPVCAVALSPWIDLSLSGLSMETRQSADPFLSRDQLNVAVGQYLANVSAMDPRANALHAPLGGLPCVQIHVGASEVLLDDALRFAQTAENAGSSVDVHVWQGMVHVFQMHVAPLLAARQSLGMAADFIKAAAARQML